MTTSLRPGIAGLGIIGQRAAATLRAKGFDPVVWSRTPHPETPGWVDSPAALAQACDVVQFFVTDGRALLTALKKMLPHLGPDKTIINSSTIALSDTRIAAKLVTTTGAAFLDAPFTGSKEAADNCELIYYLGGDPALIEKVRPVLEATSQGFSSAEKPAAPPCLKSPPTWFPPPRSASSRKPWAWWPRKGFPLRNFRQLSNATPPRPESPS